MTDKDHDKIAEDQHLHGLLGVLHSSDERQEARLTRALTRVGEHDRGQAAVSSPLPQDVPRQRPHVARWLSIAASLLAVLAAFLLFSGGESAHALVRASLEASLATQGRRYAVTITLTETPEPLVIPATLDLGRGPERALSLKTPFGVEATLGSDEESSWVAHPGGHVMRLAAERPWPNWLRLGESAVLMESVDTLLAGLLDGYALEIDAQKTTSEFTAIRALQLAKSERPELVQIRIDEESLLVESMELSWPSSPHTFEEFDREVQDMHAAMMHLGVMEVPPSFDDHDFLAPVRIHFELTQVREFPPGWFAPEAHTADN